MKIKNGFLSGYSFILNKKGLEKIMRKSVWNKDNIALPEFQPLKGDKKTDVLIIGGGLCGILCAYFLKQQGVDYIFGLR